MTLAIEALAVSLLRSSAQQAAFYDKGDCRLADEAMVKLIDGVCFIGILDGLL